jgi:hypothetical protein
MKYFDFLRFAAFLIAMAATACGGDRKNWSLDGEDAGGASGENGGAPGAGGVGSGAENAGAGNSGGAVGAVPGPVVTITSPVAVRDPNVGPVIANDGVEVVNNTITAVCDVKAAASARPVNPTSVTLEMLDANGESLEMFSAMQSPVKSSEYSAKFVFTKVPNGKVSFRCNAEDIDGTAGTSVISTFVDHGPDITRTSPEVDSAHPLGSLEVEFSVEEAPLAAGDKKATVSTAALAVNGLSVDLKDAEDSAKPGHYKLHVNLADADLFPTKVNGSIAISITATNARDVTNTDTYHFVVDSEGPTIEITAPKDSEIIGGNRLLEFTIEDTGAGVNKDSVVVTVNQDMHVFDNKGLWTEKDGKYTFSLDSANITGATIQINVNVRADDLAGNPAAGASGTYYLDTVPPGVDMDPPKLQEVKTSGTDILCSLPFDPLGNVTNDLQVIQGFARIRAIAWDYTNGGPGQALVHFAGVAPSTVKLYVQGKPDDGLLTDEDGDGACDDVDTTLPIKDLHPVDPEGSSAYLQTSPPISGVCTSSQDSSVPTKLCGGTSDLMRVIQHEQAAGPAEPVVYAIPAQDGNCDPSDLQLSSMPGVTKNGWVCLAVRALDRTGNVGVSAPLRVCLSDPSLGAAPPCAASSVQPPSCTRKCTPPLHFVPRNAAQPYIFVPQ